MAVTAHWMEVTTVQTGDGPQHLINLRSDLIGFYHVIGRHDGERLATIFMEILDRIEITAKVTTLSTQQFNVLMIGLDWMDYDGQCKQ
jgi:hypothetical protein